MARDPSRCLHPLVSLGCFASGFGRVAGFAESLTIVECVWVDADPEAFGVADDVVCFGGWGLAADSAYLVAFEDSCPEFGRECSASPRP